MVVNAVSHGSIGRGAAVTAPGLAVMTVILFMGAVSGAHLNPVVTLAFGIMASVYLPDATWLVKRGATSSEVIPRSHLFGIECKMHICDLQAASTRRKRRHRQHLGHLAAVFFARLQQEPHGTG